MCLASIPHFAIPLIRPDLTLFTPGSAFLLHFSHPVLIPTLPRYLYLSYSTYNIIKVMLLSSATGRRNSTVHVSNNTNKYKNSTRYRTSYLVQSSSPVLLLLLLLQNTNGYLSGVTFLKYIFILETLDSGISLEGMNLPYLLAQGPTSSRRGSRNVQHGKKYDHDVFARRTTRP